MKSQKTSVTQLFLATLFLFSVSCGKENKVKPDLLSSQDKTTASEAGILACFYGMEGAFATTDPTPQYTIVSNIDPYVTGGYVRFTGGPYPTPYWSSVHFVHTATPSCDLLPNTSGDTLELEVRLKNPTTGDGAVAANDVELDIIGAQNTASVLFVSQTAKQSFTRLKVGTAGVSNMSQLVRSFNDWTVVKLRLNVSTGTISTYINDVLVLSTSYNPQRVGLVKDFQVGFKGYGYVDYMRVRSSSSPTAPVLLRNEFNDSAALWDGIQFF